MESRSTTRVAAFAYPDPAQCWVGEYPNGECLDPELCSAGHGLADGTSPAAAESCALAEVPAAAEVPELTGPRGEAIAAALEAVRAVLELLDAEPCSAGEVLPVAEQLGLLLTHVQAAHTLAVGQAGTSGMWAVAGYATSVAWLRDTHRLDGGRARALERNALWLEEHPNTREALMGGRITIEHVHALRRVTTASPRRKSLYPVFEEDLLTVAENADPVRTVAVLKAWADAVDTEPADDEAESDHLKRALHLTPVGDGWDVRGWLPSTMGASLAGVLNEVMEQRRRESADDAGASAATRRADALLDLAQAALAGNRQVGSYPLLGPGARSRAKVVVTVPLFRLLNNHACCTATDQLTGGQFPLTSSNLGGECQTTSERPTAGRDPTHQTPTAHRHCSSDQSPPAWLVPDPRVFAGWWQCGNGPGQGFLASTQVRRLACDGEVQRLIVDPDSRPLDIGRTTRVVPEHMRTALAHRDGGCAMPGCQRSPGWCEAHHIHHWADGGVTSVENLALMCSRHHHELHLGQWTITMVDGVPQVSRSTRK